MLPGTLAQATASSAATSNGIAALPRARVRNSGIALDLAWVREARFTNRGATERRAATLPARRSVKKAWQAAWLLRAITCIDLTTLLGDDTPGNLKRLCAKARQPVRQDILSALMRT
jgi:deoxyribose-phosphate aldolase